MWLVLKVVAQRHHAPRWASGRQADSFEWLAQGTVPFFSASVAFSTVPFGTGAGGGGGGGSVGGPVDGGTPVGRGATAMGPAGSGESLAGGGG